MPKVRNLTKVKTCGMEIETGYVTLLGETFSVTIGEDEFDPERGLHLEHVSVSHRNLNHIPSWMQMCALKDIFWDEEEECFQLHPKRSEYCNFLDNCLHIWRVKK